MLTGCLESDVLVNYVLDQENGEVDPNRAEKLYIPDENAEQSMEDIAAQSKQTVEKLQEVVKDQAVLRDERNTDKLAEHADYEKSANSLSTTAKRKDADKGAKKESGKKASDDDGKGMSGKADGTKTDPDDTGKVNTSVDPSNNVYDSSYGNTEDLPEDVKGVCAVGEAAVMTLSLAGKGALLGTSSALLSDAGAKTVFAKRGLADAATCWKGDGLEKGDAKISKIIKQRPDAVLELSGTATLSTDDEKKLGEAGIRVIVLPALTSDDNIRDAVKAVGKIFKDATDGESSKRASAYASTVDDALATAKNAHGGGVATYGERDYNDATNKRKTTRSVMADPNWSIFITDWDAGATVSAAFNGSTLFSKVKGVASTYTGWSWSPISYYMSCGGAINNAAAYGDAFRTTAKRAFLQFNENQVTYTWGTEPEGVTLSSDGRTFDQNNGLGVLANGYDAYVAKTNSAHPLGQDDFNRVFVRTKGIKDSLEAASSKALYAPCSWQSVGNISGYGIVVSNKLLYGYLVSANKGRGDTGYDVIVNPSGMVSTWYAGSMESYLEALWVACQYYPEKVSKADVRKAVGNFYDEFYGYEPSSGELDKILDGSYAG